MMTRHVPSRAAAPLALALASALAFGCQPPADAGASAPGAAGSGPGSTAASAPARRARRVSAIVVQPERFAERIQLSATLETPKDATLSAQSAGTIDTLAPLGTQVKAGEVVAQIDAAMALASQRQAEAAVAAARAGLNLAQDTLRRQQPLADKQIISALEFERIRAQVDEARANLRRLEAGVASAREQVRYNRVVAPFDGVVEEHFVERGEQVNPGTRTLRLVDTREMKLVAGVPERFSVDIAVGAALAVDFVAYGLPPRTAKVTFVGNTIDARNRTFNIEALLDNADGKLKPQMIAKVDLTRSVVDSALVVPRTAVLTDERGPSLFLVEGVGAEAVARRLYVTLGASSGNAVVVSEGIAPGARVVVRGQNDLSDGDAIDVVEAAREPGSGAAPAAAASGAAAPSAPAPGGAAPPAASPSAAATPGNQGG